ncbi:PREDICTED: ribosome-releasing factor 2, mitochondrial [Ceratosolen solmsi marchali]|uniref:Ribosome-releasing factor 2, mitochondrial n=1 Tax=Ceratosolen solmsi marchali TaxID=326594 RepID=A0AAJ7E1R9_9HYME|nr:PREDICTED: ribosome-releasing factor 2, mitochondrial [Ceratosolen solmsi marchali]
MLSIIIQYNYKEENEKCDIEKIRNIGILAHIDAGKTTTTERMLYYSGTVKQMGEVHDGNTVTDYMDQERQRGITICSAAVSFNWKTFRFNLLDTPGHIDFTMAVEQPLTVVDGVIIILDGSAGVEAQTSTVWRQADRYNIPRIVYVNKMDKANANFEMCLKSLEAKLNVTIFPVHIPFTNEKGFAGIIDLITLEKYVFDSKTQGKTITKLHLSENQNPDLLQKALEKRRNLIDKLSDFDNNLANIIIEQESLDNISSQILVDSLRKATILRKGVPVLLGSSYKNIGVQNLMNGVVLYLPNPIINKSRSLYKCFNDELLAKVFKIIHDKQKGPIYFFRVYSGTLKRKQSIYNIQKEKMENCIKLYNVYADNYEETLEITSGNIGALTGFKITEIGNLLTSSVISVNNAKENMVKNFYNNEEIEKLFSVKRNIPDPVFFCSIEAPSNMYMPALEIALQELTKEDPSLRVTHNSETDQIIMSGMGELHIEIIKERIHSEYKINADIGELQIAYKETITNSIEDTYILNHEINLVKQEVLVGLSLIPNHYSNNKLLLNHSKENEKNTSILNITLINLVKKGILSALMRGPKLGYPVLNTGVKLNQLQVRKGTSNSVVIAAVAQGVKKLMQKSDCILLEPIMNVEIIALNEMSLKIKADLFKRRAEIKGTEIKNNIKIIHCSIPLAELLGYSNQLRKITSGTATFSMEFSHYQEMNLIEEENAIRKITGMR